MGRFGDYLYIRDLPSELRGVDVTNHFENVKEGDSGNVVVCGSPGEISNNKSEGFLFDANVMVPGENIFTVTGYIPRSFSRNVVWMMIKLLSPDQLRQRVSWALSQVSFY